jgi:hypothetical protein
MSLKQRKEVSPLTAILLIVVIIAAFIGWVLNIATLFSMPWVAETAGMLVVRVIGVIVPFIGAVLGYV